MNCLARRILIVFVAISGFSLQAGSAQVLKSFDINPGSANSVSAADFASLDGRLFFPADDGSSGRELWVSDGTSGGTFQLNDINPSGESNPQHLATALGMVFFRANDGTSGDEPWVSDGTAAGTVRLADISAGAGGSFPVGFTELGGFVYFGTSSGIYRTDGTPAGTVFVKDIRNVSSMTEMGGNLYFNGLGFGLDDTGFNELYVSDGTAVGTQIVADINPGGDSSPQDITAVGGQIFFSADDGVTGRELWVSDGTEAGTSLVLNIGPDPAGMGSFAHFFTAFRDYLYFVADDGTGRHLWQSDGTPTGTTQVSTTLSNVGWLAATHAVLYFAADDGASGAELWKYRRTSAGTVQVADLRPGFGGSNPFGLAEIDGNVYYRATDGSTGNELFVSNGTSAGTLLAADVNIGASSSQPLGIVGAGDRVFFRADDGTTGNELWAFTPNADLSVTKTADNLTPTVGSTVQFTITIANDGPLTAESIVVSDVERSGLAFLAANSTTGSFDPVSGAWDVPSLAPGAVEMLTIDATVESGAPGGSGAFIDVFASSVELDRPFGIEFGPDGHLYVASFNTSEILRYDGSTGDFLDIFASGNGLSFPVGLSFGPDGNLYVASVGSDEVLRFDGTSGAFMNVFASGSGLDAPTDVAFGPDGHLYVSSETADAVFRFDGSDGSFMEVFASGGGLDRPYSIHFGHDGHLYVASESSSEILRYDAETGDFVGTFVSSIPGLNDLTIGPNGNVYSGEGTLDRIQYFDPSGTVLGTFSSGGGLDRPFGLTFGPDGNLYVASSATNQIIRYDGFLTNQSRIISSSLLDPIVTNNMGLVGLSTDSVIHDVDGDGAPDNIDNCQTIPNPAQGDDDGDGIGNLCDNCPVLASTNVKDTDGDGAGDPCDMDDDNDMLADTDELLYGTDPNNPDTDGDGFNDFVEISEGTDPTRSDSYPGNSVKSDSLALVALYNSTSGSSWYRSSNWLQSPIRDWYGVTVENDGRVTKLELDFNQLEGTIPSSIQQLSRLESLDLSGNLLIGSIPKSLDSLNSLEYLNLGGNSIDGGIPVSIGYISNLKHLYLGPNELGGTIPSTLGDLSLLRTLHLQGSRLDGTIPVQLGKLNSLQELALYSNNLDGTIPESLADLLELYNLFLYDNNLSGSVPRRISEMPNLSYLSIFKNSIDDIPSFTNTPKLTSLSVSRNNLTFEDIEPNASLRTFFYSPQSLVGSPDEVLVSVALPVNITIPVGGANNVYQWYKDGIAIPGANTDTFSIESATYADEGVYTLEINNTVVTDLTLTSHPITVFIGASGEETVTAGDPPPTTFGDTGTSIDFSSVDAETTVEVNRYDSEPTDVPVFFIQELGSYWNIEQTGATSFTADVCFSLENLAPEVNPNDLEILKRESASDPWVVHTPTLEPDETNPTHICLDDVSDFSDFLAVIRQPPAISDLSAPADPVQTGSEVTATASFTNPNSDATHTATWDWGDGSTTSGTMDESGGDGTVEDSHTYDLPGVYTVSLTVTDAAGPSTTEMFEYVVVYDPSGGFVTGGGWIDSPPEACPDFCNGSTGKAGFGFVSKYKKGQTVPTGETEFNFKAGGLNFHSGAYDWLVIAGPSAKFKGVGQINGNGEYGFMLTARDGDANGGDGDDRFRIKIWETDESETIVYDNKPGETDDSDAADAIGGGSIVIHDGKKKAAKAGVAATGTGVPEEYALHQNYPNPFNPSTNIRFALPEAAHVEITLYDILGREIQRLVPGRLEAGLHTIRYDASHLPSGLYIYSLTANDFEASRTLILSR